MLLLLHATFAVFVATMTAKPNEQRASAQQQQHQQQQQQARPATRAVTRAGVRDQLQQLKATLPLREKGKV